MKEVRVVATEFAGEELGVLVQDRCKLRRQRSGERAIEARCFVAVALLRQVDHPIATVLLFERVAEA